MTMIHYVTVTTEEPYVVDKSTDAGFSNCKIESQFPRTVNAYCIHQQTEAKYVLIKSANATGPMYLCEVEVIGKIYLYSEYICLRPKHPSRLPVVHSLLNVQFL